jgi:hypothetical protein
MKTQIFRFNFPLKFFMKICDIWTFPRKIEIKIITINLLSRIKFRGPELSQGSSLQSLSSFQSLRTQRPQGLEPYCEATRKDPDPKKIQRASFDLTNLCANFQDHILTGSTLNRGTTRPPRDQICACLL